MAATANNLPAQLTSFVGRAGELVQAGMLLDRYRLVTLTGAGGVGKTRLALQLAAGRLDVHPGGCWYVELASLSDGGDVWAQVADAVGARVSSGGDLFGAVAARLDGDETVLVLDNCEHVLDECASMVAVLTRRLARLRVLATSRQPLDVDGEVVWRVPSLSLPTAGDATSVSLDVIAASDAVALFCERATRSRPGFVLDAANADGVRAVCEQLDGVPLAIELAAARLRSTGLADISNGVATRFALLDSTRHGVLPRHRTLAACVEWSYDLLGADHQRLFRALSVFSGSFDTHAADAVAGPGVASILTDLVDRSLVQLDDTTVPTRYRYLTTIREFGRARLDDTGEAAEVRDRHLAYHLAVAEQAADGVVGRDQHAWLVRLDVERDDLRQALEWASSSADTDTLLRLVFGLGMYWHERGHGTEGRRWCDRALTEAADAPARRRAGVHWVAAHLAGYDVDVPNSISHAQIAIELATAADDPMLIARSMDTLWTSRQFIDPASSQAGLLDAHALATKAGDQWAMVDTLQKAAYCDLLRDRWSHAFEHQTRVDALSVPLGNRLFLAWDDLLKGWGALRHGRLDDARHHLTSAWENAVAVGEPSALVESAGNLVETEIRAGNLTEAEHWYHTVTAALARHGGEFAELAAVVLPTVLTLPQGEPSPTRALHIAAADALRDAGVPVVEGALRLSLALSDLAAGELAAATVTLDRLRQLGDLIGNTRWVAVADLGTAAVHRRADRADLAEPLARAALDRFHAGQFLPDVLDAVELLGGCLLDLGNPTAAHRLITAACATRDQHGLRSLTPTLFTADAERDLVTAAGQLDDHDIVAGVTDLDDVISWARRARGTRSRPQHGWASLTPTELDVVRLITTGRSNPEIANDLYMSRATVKTHVSHILAKLAVRTRVEIATASAEHQT